MSSRIRHLLIIEDDRNGVQHVVLGAPIHTLGRDPKCDIRLASQFVSRRQATLVQISHEDGTLGYRIVDGVPKGKPSSNGMRINGHKTLACDLQDCDEIMFGPHVRVVYRMLEQPNAPAFDDTLTPTKEFEFDRGSRPIYEPADQKVILHQVSYAEGLYAPDKHFTGSPEQKSVCHL